ncbi:MAG: penicillin-binding transpeptidase domain-containing protein, partial [Oscillospiraceae bacterium]
MKEVNRAGKSNEQIYSWFTDNLINEVISDYMAQNEGMTSEEAFRHMYNDGWKIYATMVPEVQNAMEDAMQNDFKYGDVYPDREIEIEEVDSAGNPILDENGEQKTHKENVQAGMVSLNYKGEIVGIVGGLGEKKGMREFNRGSDMQRQIGSTMKPIGAYALGIELDRLNYSFPLLDDWVKEIPDEKHGGMKQWPRNYNGKYTETNMLVCDALQKSINTVAVRSLMTVGADTSYEFVKDILQVENLVDSDRGEAPMALGATTHGLTPIELAGAYMIFGDGGLFVTPHSYTSVVDRNGETILEPTVSSTQAISEETAMIMNKMLYRVVHGGTANGLWVRDAMDSVGKTGTTNDDKDHWFVGLTPYYVSAAWMGYDTPTPIN